MPRNSRTGRPIALASLHDREALIPESSASAEACLARAPPKSGAQAAISDRAAASSEWAAARSANGPLSNGGACVDDATAAPVERGSPHRSRGRSPATRPPPGWWRCNRTRRRRAACSPPIVSPVEARRAYGGNGGGRWRGHSRAGHPRRHRSGRVRRYRARCRPGTRQSQQAWPPEAWRGDALSCPAASPISGDIGWIRSAGPCRRC